MGFEAGVGLGDGMPIGNAMGSAINVSPNTQTNDNPMTKLTQLKNCWTRD